MPDIVPSRVSAAWLTFDSLIDLIDCHRTWLSPGRRTVRDSLVVDGPDAATTSFSLRQPPEFAETRPGQTNEFAGESHD